MVALLSDKAFALAIGARACGVPPPVPLRRDHRDMLADLAGKQREAPAPIPMRHIEEAKRQSLPELIAVLAEGKQRNDPAMTHQIKSLADVLQSLPARLDRALSAGEKLTKSLDGLEDAVATVDAVSAQVDKHTAGVRALLAGFTNGGPPMDDDKPAAPKAGDA